MATSTPQPDRQSAVGGSAEPAPETAARRIDVARLAHELRTPLGAIAVLAEILRDERLGPLGSERYRAYAADIHRSAAHANTVLAAFLDQESATGEDGGPLEFAELDLAGVTAGGVSALTAVAERAGVRLSARIPAGLPHVIADRRSLLQILNNLISNALKFTPPGGLIEVSLAYAPGGPVVMEVADTGDGMSEAELDRVRGHGARTAAFGRRSGGTGIGIPLVRTLATASGASFVVESSLGKGTRARISFPHDHVVPV
jgi:signal transduction histidine kinase